MTVSRPAGSSTASRLLFTSTAGSARSFARCKEQLSHGD
jgi:hypothetical protein